MRRESVGRFCIQIQYLASESLGVRSFSIKVITDDLSLLLDPSCALGPIPNFPTPHPFEYVALQKCTQRIVDAAKDADLISISHYHHDHFKPKETNWEYIWSSPDIFQQIFQDKKVFGKNPAEHIGANQRARAQEFLRDLTNVNGSFVPSDNQSFTSGGTSVHFSPPLSHGPPGSKLGHVIGTCIRDSEMCFCSCPDVQGPTSIETLNWILDQEPQILAIGGPPLFLPPPKFTPAMEREFFAIIAQLADHLRLIVMDHHILRNDSGIKVFFSLKDKLSVQNCSLLNFAGQNNQKGYFLEAKRPKIYADYPPPEQFLRWANIPKKTREITPPPLQHQNPI